ncbi:uncharacterized protein BXZ73DRAFT_87955 [Epithele typhae]|uniref:uncharacterized protein n=1 Tax=Epithele typhae TaxID=378194 RepID=UPI00200765C0|nr:uncharacterized protein BXZ73DRAFT_87955 [Epithele typhae]KAH9942342.1 hypothetical protein BXZ73DRAFT_87955 [Epithele typhae]
MASATRDQVQRAAMLASVSGRSFEDIKFWAFSRRSHTGVVDEPLPLLANSGLLHKVTDHFKFVLSTGFAEGDVVEMEAPFPSTRSSRSDMYDYGADSDLEDEDEFEGEPSDVKLGPSVSGRGNVKVGSAGAMLSTQMLITKPGRVVHVEDVAYHTLKAFIFWAYYEELNFAPLKSQQKMLPTEQNAYNAPFCSPKSMYRLAHRYNVDVLKKKALDDIKSKLSPHNILEEVFSHFTSLYDDIRDMELEYLHANIKDSGIQARLPAWIRSMQGNELPESACDILSSLVLKIINGPLPQPSDPKLKKCPNGCSAANYTCRNCGTYF